MKILYIVPNPPSLVRVRSYNLIRYLAARGHRLTVATVWANEEEFEDIEHLRAQGIDVLAAPLSSRQIVRNLATAVGTGAPLQAFYNQTPELLQIMANHLNGSKSGNPLSPAFDLIHVEHLRGARYVLRLGELLRSGAEPKTFPLPVVWDSVDCITYLFQQASVHSRSLFSRLMTRMELSRTRRYEGKLAAVFDRVLVTSRIDRQALERMRCVRNGRPLPEISVLPNGVDLDHFTPVGGPRAPATIVFSGKMSYHANVTAALYLVNDVMPLVWACFPQAKLVIAGKDPASELYRISRSMANVQLTGTVPDLRPYLRHATVAVSPLAYGAGIQNKVLEAMACGTPVVASPQAVSALDTVADRHLLVADNAAIFARHILDVLSDQSLRLRLSVAARHYVERHHNWAWIAEQLEQIYQAVCFPTPEVVRPLSTNDPVPV